jgi:predicted SnoaL-like aldol condensation-catalyzing enzyme
VSLAGTAAGTAGWLPTHQSTQQSTGASVGAAAVRRHNIELVTTALQVVFTQHRIDQIDRYFSPDFIQHSPLVSDPGRDGLKNWLTRTVASIPDLTYTSNQVLADGDRVITFSTVTGTIVNDMPEYGIKANGQKLNVLTAHIFRVAQQPDRRTLGGRGHRPFGPDRAGLCGRLTAIGRGGAARHAPPLPVAPLLPVAPDGGSVIDGRR